MAQAVGNLIRTKNAVFFALPHASDRRRVRVFLAAGRLGFSLSHDEQCYRIIGIREVPPDFLELAKAFAWVTRVKISAAIPPIEEALRAHSFAAELRALLAT